MEYEWECHWKLEDYLLARKTLRKITAIFNSYLKLPEGMEDMEDMED